MTDQRAPVAREVPETVTSAAYLAIYGEGMDPFQHPEGWEYAESIASAILSALPATAAAPDVSEERARDDGPPWRFDRFVGGIRMAEGIKITNASTFEEACDKAAKLAPDAPCTVLVARAFDAQPATVGEGLRPAAGFVVSDEALRKAADKADISVDRAFRFIDGLAEFGTPATQPEPVAAQGVGYVALGDVLEICDEVRAYAEKQYGVAEGVGAAMVRRRIVLLSAIQGASRPSPPSSPVDGKE